MPISDNSAMANVIYKRRVGIQKRGNLRLNSLRQELSGARSQNVRQRVLLKIRWVPKGNNGILFHGVSFLGLGQVVTSTITRIRRLQFNAVHKIRL
jgi:hypothetical protein